MKTNPKTFQPEEIKARYISLSYDSSLNLILKIAYKNHFKKLLSSPKNKIRQG